MDFFLICQIFVLTICIYLGFGAVEGAMCKIWERLGQYPRRNNLPKLATFDPIFQLPHSAMMTPVMIVNPGKDSLVYVQIITNTMTIPQNTITKLPT